MKRDQCNSPDKCQRNHRKGCILYQPLHLPARRSYSPSSADIGTLHDVLAPRCILIRPVQLRCDDRSGAQGWTRAEFSHTPTLDDIPKSCERRSPLPARERQARRRRCVVPRYSCGWTARPSCHWQLHRWRCGDRMKHLRPQKFQVLSLPMSSDQP